LISAIPALRRLRQEVQKFEASLRYIKSKKKKEKEEEKEQEHLVYINTTFSLSIYQ
jgi:hypothetical protein